MVGAFPPVINFKHLEYCDLIDIIHEKECIIELLENRIKELESSEREFISMLETLSPGILRG